MKAAVEIRFTNVEGHQIEPPLNLGAYYNVVASVINRTTTRGDYPYEAEMEVGFGIDIGGIEVVPYTIGKPMLYSPELIINHTYKIYIPKEWAGLSGKVVANVFDPFNGVLASATKHFKVSYELSPEAKYKIETGVMKGMDLPSLSPDEYSEGVVMAVEGAESQSPAPAPPAPKKVDYTKGRPASGLDTTTEPEPPVEFEGETFTQGERIG